MVRMVKKRGIKTHRRVTLKPGERVVAIVPCPANGETGHLNLLRLHIEDKRTGSLRSEYIDSSEFSPSLAALYPAFAVIYGGVVSALQQKGIKLTK